MSPAFITCHITPEVSLVPRASPQKNREKREQADLVAWASGDEFTMYMYGPVFSNTVICLKCTTEILRVCSCLTSTLTIWMCMAGDIDKKINLILLVLQSLSRRSMQLRSNNPKNWLLWRCSCRYVLLHMCEIAFKMFSPPSFCSLPLPSLPPLYPFSPTPLPFLTHPSTLSLLLPPFPFPPTPPPFSPPSPPIFPSHPFFPIYRSPPSSPPSFSPLSSPPSSVTPLPPTHSVRKRQFKWQNMQSAVQLGQHVQVSTHFVGNTWNTPAYHKPEA